MNYRHAFHAGNHGDVLKHVVLTLCLARLLEKPKPVCVIDTHAGIGRYDLATGPAQRTGEYRDGIAKVLDLSHPALDPYLAIVRAMGGDAPATYPGSPALAQALLRPGDRLVCAELHPEDATSLRRSMAGDERVSVHQRDGFEALPALVPPPERRGLVLIDPAYEAADDVDRAVAALARAWARWPTGTYLLWYPIKDRGLEAALTGGLRSAGLAPLLQIELLVREALAHKPGPKGPEPAQGLSGSGVLVVRPPYTVAESLTAALPLLHARLQTTGGTWRVEEV